MADSLYRNGCQVLIRQEIEDQFFIAMEATEKIETIFDSIKRLIGEGDKDVARLAALGSGIADEIHNSLDYMRERAKKAGVIGELIEEARHD